MSSEQARYVSLHTVVKVFIELLEKLAKRPSYDWMQPYFVANSAQTRCTATGRGKCLKAHECAMEAVVYTFCAMHV
jgi:hypothetical protein